MLEALFFFVLGGGVLSIACSNRRAWREIERKSEPAPEWLAMAKADREKYGDSVPPPPGDHDLSWTVFP